MKINKYLERHEFLKPPKLSSIVLMHKVELIKQITGLLVYYTITVENL